MSNEKKRDVFEDLVEELADAYIALDGEGIGKELTNEDKQAYLKDYDAALPDDLPVIPLAVAYAIEWFQQNDETIGEVWRNLYEDVDDDWNECPQLREAEEWMLDNQDTFTRAWVLGQWEAEK